MGVERRVRFEQAPPSWSAARAELEAAGFAPSMRMIDGEIALPDEEPADQWGELRVALDGRMVTVKRAGAEVTVVTWGEADEATTRAYDAVSWALAAAADGTIVTERGELSSEAFARERLASDGAR